MWGLQMSVLGLKCEVWNAKAEVETSACSESKKEAPLESAHTEQCGSQATPPALGNTAFPKAFSLSMAEYVRKFSSMLR